jgi:hypothetical protein
VIGSPEMERAARRSATRPFSRRGKDPAELLAALDSQFTDRSEIRELARMRQEGRLRRQGGGNLDSREALSWLMDHLPVHGVAG